MARRFHRGKRFVPDAFSKGKKSQLRKEKLKKGEFSLEERQAACEVVWWGITDYMRYLRTPVYAMKSKDIKTILRKIQEYLEKYSLAHDPNRRLVLEGICRKLQAILGKRAADLEKRKKSK